jgi:thioredoxin reductase (NADPH)
VHLAQHGADVHIVSRSPLAKSMSQYLIDRIEKRGIVVHTEARVAAVHGTRKAGLDHVTVADPNIVASHEAAGLFVFIGAEPRTDWAPTLAKDRRGFILTGPEGIGTRGRTAG